MGSTHSSSFLRDEKSALSLSCSWVRTSFELVFSRSACWRMTKINEEKYFIDGPAIDTGIFGIFLKGKIKKYWVWSSSHCWFLCAALPWRMMKPLRRNWPLSFVLCHSNWKYFSNKCSVYLSVRVSNKNWKAACLSLCHLFEFLISVKFMLEFMFFSLTNFTYFIYLIEWVTLTDRIKYQSIKDDQFDSLFSSLMTGTPSRSQTRFLR